MVNEPSIASAATEKRHFVVDQFPERIAGLLVAHVQSASIWN
jgi:hypothetical protein